MALTEKCMGQVVAPADAPGLLYSLSTGKRAILIDIVFSNSSSQEVQVSMWVVPLGSAPSLQNIFIPEMVVPPNDILHLRRLYQVLDTAGDSIRIQAALADSITVRASGVEI